jgi:hypothetical protein
VAIEEKKAGGKMNRPKRPFTGKRTIHIPVTINKPPEYWKEVFRLYGLGVSSREIETGMRAWEKKHKAKKEER